MRVRCQDFHRVAKPALILATISSLVVSARFAMATLSIWMGNRYQRETPPINAFTVPCGVTLVAALAGIVYRWSRVRVYGLGRLALW